MTEDEAFAHFGLRPPSSALAEIRELLARETARERQAQGLGDTELMRVLCVGLFNAGDPTDCLRIFAAKRASMDANGAVDIQLLCGAGLAATKAILRADGSTEAAVALQRILDGEASGEFDGFSVAGFAAQCDRYFGV